MARTSLSLLVAAALGTCGTGASLPALAAGAPAETATTPVLAHAVTRGQALSASDFVEAPLSPSAARGSLSATDVDGMEARRNLRAGAPVRATDITTARLVHRGDSVTIEVVSGALQITSAGRALDDASRGENVRVFNTATNRTIEGVAHAAGRVAIQIR